jgi:hypothetical protein
MHTARPNRSMRSASLAWVTCLLLAIAARPQSFAQRVQRVTLPSLDSAGAFCATARWGGRLFILFDAACFWTSGSPATADGNGGWTRQNLVRTGPKGSIPAAQGGWFTRCANGLWLGNREGALAWRFDTAAGAWAAWPSGTGAMAAAGNRNRLFVLAPDHVLRSTRNAGDTWEEIVLPAEVRSGTFFDDILADGDHLILRSRDPARSQPAARSFDGGATWAFLPAHALPVLAHGRLYAFGDSLLGVHRPGAESLTLPAPRARAAFADSAGLLFAWADSGLYVLDAQAAVDAAAGILAPGADPHVPNAWSPAAAPDALRGWSLGRDILYRLEGGSLEWFDGLPIPADAAQAHARRGIIRPRPGYRFDPADPGGFRLESSGSDWDPVGRPVRGTKPR